MPAPDRGRALRAKLATVVAAIACAGVAVIVIVASFLF